MIGNGSVYLQTSSAVRASAACFFHTWPAFDHVAYRYHEKYWQHAEKKREINSNRNSVGAVL